MKTPPPPSPFLSIIIPAFNEATEIAATVDAAAAAASGLGRPCEVIVVDDASTDATATVAAAHGARVVAVHHRQIARVRNAGAKAARGRVFAFVDADTRIRPATLANAVHAVESGFIAAGATVRFDEHGGMEGRAAAETWNLLSRLARWLAGSFIVMERKHFETIGGFDDQLFAAEELRLSGALKKRGRIAIVGPAVTTSSRKLRTHQWLAHWILLAKVLWTRGRVLRRRDDLHIWYDGKREASTSAC